MCEVKEVRELELRRGFVTGAKAVGQEQAALLMRASGNKFSSSNASISRTVTSYGAEFFHSFLPLHGFNNM